MLKAPWKADKPTAARAVAENTIETVREPEPGFDNAPEQRRQEFIALISHELRNPLTAIIGYAQLMQRRGAFDEKAVTMIVDQAGQLSRLVGDLLDSSTLEAGRLQLQSSRMDLVALARASIEQAQLMSPFHFLRLESREGQLEGWWDRARLGQVLANLLGNAIKYSPPGGEVLVRIEDLGSAARVSIRDRGPGIAPEALPRLFDQFYRAPATAGAVPGLGVGLHVARALVEAHGGSISAESVLGQGTTFSCTLSRLPSASCANGASRLDTNDGRLLLLLISHDGQTATQLATASNLSPTETLRQLGQLVDRGFIVAADDAGTAVYQLKPKGLRPGTSDPRQHILVVEDDLAVREISVSILEDEGYAVISTAVPTDAVQLLTDITFDLVITDGFSQTEAAVLASSADVLEQAGETPVILFTAHKVELDAALLAGFRDLIAKPFEVETFERQVRALLQD